MEPYKRRLAKELIQLVNEPPSGVQISEDDAASDFSIWTVSVDGASNTLYEGETFKLRFKFDNQYPFTSPEVSNSLNDF
jgi:ubiquitin-conjugating enzyme E2 W